MSEMELLGTILTSLITICGFVVIVIKLNQPINDLRVVIQKLNDSIDSALSHNETQDCRLNKHGEEIDNLGHRVTKIETKVDLHLKK